MNGGEVMRWLEACELEEIPRLGARVITIGALDIAVFRTSSDRIFALRDRCPHRGGPLSQGIVHGNCVTCPLHDWVIDLESGEAKGPDEGRTLRFPIRLDGATVMVGIPDAISGTAPDATEQLPEPLVLAR